MKVIHVTYSGAGGAGIAARRSHEALTAAGVKSHLLCARNAPSGCDLLGRRRLRKCWHAINYQYEKWRRRKLPSEDQCLRSASLFPGFMLKEIEAFSPDIVNLHWINSGTLSVSEIQKINVPVVWTLHDMWPLTGSSHCAGSMLEPWRQAGMPHAFATLDPTEYCRELEASHADKMRCKPEAMISPSRWMHNQVGKAEFTADKETPRIPNCLNLETFYPVKDKAKAKRKLGLPEDKNVLLFVSSWANNPIKGFDLLDQAFSNVAEVDRRSCVIAMLGAHGGESNMHGIPIFHLGNRVGDQEVAVVYQAADIFLCPSREDNYPNTVLEASACAVPTVAFDIGGLPDLIDHQVSGMLAEPYNPIEFATCIVDALKQCAGLGDAARRKSAKQNDPERHAAELIKLYSTLVSKALS